MSTRSSIALPEPGGWRGVFHHWDGYPTGLGATLLDLYDSRYDGEFDAMARELVLDSPAGWSTINGSWEPREGEDSPIVCRCPDDPTDCDPLFIEWAYALTPEGIDVYAAARAQGVTTIQTASHDAYNKPNYLHHLIERARWRSGPGEMTMIEKRGNDLCNQMSERFGP